MFPLLLGFGVAIPAILGGVLIGTDNTDFPKSDSSSNSNSTKTVSTNDQIRKLMSDLYSDKLPKLVAELKSASGDWGLDDDVHETDLSNQLKDEAKEIVDSIKDINARKKDGEYTGFDKELEQLALIEKALDDQKMFLVKTYFTEFLDALSTKIGK